MRRRNGYGWEGTELWRGPVEVEDRVRNKIGRGRGQGKVEAWLWMGEDIVRGDEDVWTGRRKWWIERQQL